MQVATAKHKPEPHPTASAGSAFQPRTQVAGSGLGAGAGMPAFLQRKGKGNDKSHATAMDSDPPQGQLGPDEEELLVPIQKKMVIGAADDPLEREADDVARSATTQPAATQTAALQRKEGGQEACSCGGTCSACASQGKLQRSATPAAAPVSAAPAPLPGGEGAPLSGAVRKRVEPLLGADLSSVRVHAGPQSARSAEAMNARAYTHQNHIWLGPSQSPEDIELMAHEATHVVQQGSAPGVDGLVQRRPEDYEHPEDGATVQQQMGAQVAKATEGGEDGSEAGDGDTDSGGAGAPESGARSAAQSVDPAEREEKKGELEPYSKPPADRAAEAQPQVAASASEVTSEADQPSEPLAEGQEKTPADREKGAGRMADQAAALGAAAFAQAAAETLPDVPAPVLPPVPVAPVNAEGEMVQPDPVADDAATQLGLDVQRMRDEGLVARQRATGLRANADRMRGNLRIARGATDSAEQGVTRAQGHVESRREVVAQARDALAVSEEKAATVAAQAPEYASRATQTHEDSGPMASEAQAKAGEAGGNSPDDEEAAGKMQEASGQMSQVGSDATNVDNAVTGTQARGEALIAEAEQAQEKNTATTGKLDATDAAIEQTDARLGELNEQNEAARAKIAGVEQGPARLDAGAAAMDAQALAVLTASDDLEGEIHAAQADFESDMHSLPGSKAIADASKQSGADQVVQRDAQSAYGDRVQVDILGAFRGPASAAAQQEQAERAERVAERRRQRLREINDRAKGHFENLSATDKMGIALDIMGENLMDDLGGARWPNILGQVALAFVDPAVSLEGVVSGLNMTLSGAANLLSLQQWERDPLGNLLKSAADIATGLTIILGSIAGLCTAILVILGALAIITFGAMGPAFAAASAFLGPIITTVGGWAISCAAIAAELQFYVLIKNLVDAATATTAEGLEHESDQMTEDATQAANMAAQVVTAGVMEAGGAALAETAVGQRLGAMATSVGERFDMIPPPRGTPVLEPGAAAAPEVTAAPVEPMPASVEAAAPRVEATPAPVDAPAAPVEAPAAPVEAPAAPVEGAAGSRETPTSPVEAGGAPVEAPAAPTEPAAPPREPVEAPRPGETPAGTKATPTVEEPVAPAGAGEAAPVEAPAPEAPSQTAPSTPEAPAPEPQVAEAPAAATPEEAALLEGTAGKSGEELTPAEALGERSAAERSEAKPIDDPPFTSERELPNGHTIEEAPEGDLFKRCSRRCAIYDSEGELVEEVVEDLPDAAAQDAKGVAHDIGVQQGREAALADNLQEAPDWVNPLEDRGPYGQGFDEVRIDPNGNEVIVEYKGGAAELAPGQMSREWVQDVINRMRASGDVTWANRLQSALDSGRLTGVAYSTPIDPVTGVPGPTTVVGRWTY